MDCVLPVLLAVESQMVYWIVGGIAGAVLGLVVLLVGVTYFPLWFQAYMSGANVSIWSLIGMSFRRVNSRVIVRAKIMAMQAGIGGERDTGISTRRIEALYLAGGNVPNVIQALIAAHRAGIDLDFDRGA